MQLPIKTATFRIPASILLLPFLVACTDSRQLNPSNWVGSSERSETVLEAPVIKDRRPLVAQVSGLRADRHPGGIILVATGLPESQGHWRAELVPVNNEVPADGLLTYEFVVETPLAEARTGTSDSREVVAARSISSRKLRNVARIRVVSDSNVRDLRL